MHKKEQEGKPLSRKEGITLFVSVACLLAILMLAQTLMPRSSVIPQFAVYGIGDPDSKGNCITELKIYQDIGGWQLLLTHTTSDNFTCQVTSDTHTRFDCQVRLNKTLADNEEESFDYTRVYITIEGEYTDQLMSNVTGSSDANFWYVTYRLDWNASGKPAYGVDYDVSFDYDAYY